MTSNRDTDDNPDFSQVFRGANDALRNHRYDGDQTTSKLFGLLEMDSAIISYVNAGYNVLVGESLEFWRPKVYGALRRALEPSFKGKKETLNRTAAGGMLALDTVLYALPYVSKLKEQISSQHRERTELVHTIAPVLDEIKGAHSLHAFYAVRESDNEMIYAQRRRMQKINHAHNIRESLGLVVQIAPNMTAHERDHAGAVINGKEPANIVLKREIRRLKRQTDDLVDGYRGRVADYMSQRYSDIHPDEVTFENLRHAAMYDPELSKDTKLQQALGKLKTSQNDLTPRKSRDRDDDESGFNFGKLFLSGGNFAITPIVDKYNESSERRLKKSLQPYSAMEMVLELDKQVRDKADSSSYAAPGGESYPLEEYIARVMIQHQKDMSDLDPKYTQIREALKEDLGEAAKPIAEAIRAGDISALSLIRLVGEGKVIKNKGRAIASADEVSALIQSMAGKTQNPADTKKYFDNSNFTLKDLKPVLAGLEGEEKILFAAMFPQEVLREAGMSAKEIRQVHETKAKDFAHARAMLLAGISEDAVQLKKSGLTGKQVGSIESAQQALREDGEAAVDKLKSTPAEESGIEHSIASLVMSKIQGDKSYFGTLMNKGREALAAMATNENGTGKADGHSAREATRRMATNESDLEAAAGRTA